MGTRHDKRTEADALQLDICKDGILVILIDAQVPHCNSIGRVVVYIHQGNGRNTAFPGMVTEGLAQGVAAYVVGQVTLGCRFSNNAIGLVAVYGFFTSGTLKNIVVWGGIKRVQYFG